MTACAGDYFSPELGRLYSLAVDSGQLVGRSLRYADVPFILIGRNTAATNLRHGLRTLHFYRDAEDEILGFDAGGLGVHGIRFYKLPPGFSLDRE